MRSLKHLLAAGAVTAGLALSATPSLAATCVGSCGTLGPDGVVVSPPGGGSYSWISTFGGLAGVGQIAGAGGTDGSQFTSGAFTANAGDVLEFYFNYVTSDGHLPDDINYEDYTWAELQTAAGASVAMLYTARTEASGSIVPGQGLPDIQSSLTPATLPIIPGAPTWAPLGDSSASCWGPGCGYTGWVRSRFTVADGGSYRLALGVTNYVDEVYDSGLAFTGLTIAGHPIDDDFGVPEPSSWAMMILGFGVLGAALRRRRAVA